MIKMNIKQERLCTIVAKIYIICYTNHIRANIEEFKNRNRITETSYENIHICLLERKTDRPTDKINHILDFH